MRMVFFRSFILFHIFRELLKAAVGIHGDVLVFPVYHAVGDEKNAHAGFLRGHVLGLLLMPPHFFKAPGSGLFLRFGLPEAFIKLKIFRFAGFYIVFVFRLVF